MDPYSAADVLNTLLAVQALLIAASTLAATIGRRSPERPAVKDYTPYKAACVIAGLMICATVGGAAAWVEVFVCDSDGIENFGDVLQAAALAAPLLVIPIFGVVAVGWAKP